MKTQISFLKRTAYFWNEICEIMQIYEEIQKEKEEEEKSLDF